MSKLRRQIVALAGATLLLAALVSPALAVVSKDGTHYCQTYWTPYARSYSTGNTWLYPPGSGTGHYFYNGSNWTVRKVHSPYGEDGGYWLVQTDGSLSDPGTYAGCTPAS